MRVYSSKSDKWFRNQSHSNWETKKQTSARNYPTDSPRHGNLDESKATQSNDIPTKVIKENDDIFATFITENFNNMIENSIFPDLIKQADIKPVYKKTLGIKRKITS